MENNNLKNTWKSEIGKCIKCYSDEELRNMVVKSARKSMKSIQPSVILWIVIAVVTIFLVWSIVFGNETSSIKMVYFTALLILSVACFMVVYSARKLNRHKMDTPIKEWLKYRIDEIEKSCNFMVKYDFFIFGGSFLVGYTIFLVFQILRDIHFNWISVIIFIAMFIYGAIGRHFQMKNYNKTLQQLKELYKQLEEENL